MAFYERNAMRYGKLIVVAACGALFVVGCKKHTNESTPAAERMQHSAEKMSDNAKDTAKSAGNAMENTAENAKENASNAADQASKAVSDSAAVKTATDELAQVQEYIKDHKYDLAEKTLDKVEDNKASLPESITAQIPPLRKQIEALKAAPAVPAK
jgi:hypothetical protein